MITNIYKTYRHKFLLSLIPVVMVGIMAPLRSYIIQLLIDCSNGRELLQTGMIAAVFSIAVFLFEWVSKRCQAAVVRNIEKDLRSQLMHKLLYVSPDYYFSKITADIQILLDAGVNNVYDMVVQFVFLAAAVSYILWIEPFILLIAAAVSMVQFGIPSLLKKKISSSRKAYTEALEAYLDGEKSNLAGHKDIRTFDTVKQLVGRQEKLSDFVSGKNERFSRTLYWAQALSSFVNNGAFLAVLGSCMFFAAAGRITVGEAVGITNMMNFVLTPCKTIADGMIQLKERKKVEAELEDLLEQDRLSGTYIL